MCRSFVLLPQTTVVLQASSVIEGLGLEVKVHPSIEPSDGRWGEGRVSSPLKRPEPLTAKANAVVCCHICCKGLYCVHAKLRRDKSWQCNYCVSSNPALKWFSKPHFDRFPRQASLTGFTLLLFKTLSTLNPCFTVPGLNTALIVSLCRPRRNCYTLQDYFWTLFLITSIVIHLSPLSLYPNTLELSKDSLFDFLLHTPHVTLFSSWWDAMMQCQVEPTPCQKTHKLYQR